MCGVVEEDGSGSSAKVMSAGCFRLRLCKAANDSCRKRCQKHGSQWPRPVAAVVVTTHGYPLK